MFTRKLPSCMQCWLFYWQRLRGSIGLCVLYCTVGSRTTSYGKKFSIKFHAAKSALLYFSKGKQPHACFPQFSNDDYLINLAIEYTHLGHIISANLDDSCKIVNKRNSLCCKINNVLCYFRNRNPAVKLKLLSSYCNVFLH